MKKHFVGFMSASKVFFFFNEEGEINTFGTCILYKQVYG